MAASIDLQAPPSNNDLSRFDGGRINLSTTPADAVFNKELRRVCLQGKLANYVVPDRCNLIESKLIDFDTIGVDFSRCDFKDNTIINSHFSKTKFVGAGFALNTLTKSHFDACDFYDTVIQNCEFYDVEFRDCDFSSLVIKDCVFARCNFFRCKTSNKLIEMSLLEGCHFEETQLQLQTITENFGLRIDEISSAVRSDRIDHAHTEMDRSALENELAREARPLARLAMYYFLDGNLLNGSEHLDAALDVSYWIKTQATIGSFSIVLTRLCEFLLYLHERDELAYMPLLQLHLITGKLASAVQADARLRQAEFAVYGTHLSIARQIDDFGQIMHKFTNSRRRNWTFLVDGKHPKLFYRTELSELFERGRPRIISLVPHNSPWEMMLGFSSSAAVGTFLALFFATRTRIELRRMLDATTTAAPGRQKHSKRASTQVAQLVLGAAGSTESKSLVYFTTKLSPTLAADFQLSVSTRCIGRIRRIMLTWLK
jgi:uncharacterized protein YjbI with pentapeptide repeats